MLRAASGRTTGLAAGTIAVLAALAAATALAALLEEALRLDNASAVYLLAVVAVAIRLGTTSAVATAIGSVLVYNFLFVDPRFTLTVSRAEEVLTLLLLLFVGIVIGRLAGLQRDRERQALRREREARALFGISRELATSTRLTDAIQSVVTRLATEAGMERTWVAVGATVPHERVVADSAGLAASRPSIGTHSVLHRDSEEGAATWIRIHPPVSPAGTHAGPRVALFRVELRSGGETLGSLWSERRASSPMPQLEETRLMAAAADQLGQAIRRERLGVQAAELEIARRSDELKSALVDSVSHDLRTPLATIRAAAGSLADPDIELAAEDRRQAARAIDVEAERLNRLVGNLLDMSRIQAGSIVLVLGRVGLDEVVPAALSTLPDGATDVVIDVPETLPRVEVDAQLLERAVANVVGNAQQWSSGAATVSVVGRRKHDGVELRVVDHGPGVAPDDRERMFLPFQRLGDRAGSDGVGLGLAVARGFVEAMGASLTVEETPGGGLTMVFSFQEAT